MKMYNKIQVASDMFVEAHNRYTSPKNEIDNIVSILLSGAVVGIISPLLKEQGGHTEHELLSRISNSIADHGEKPVNESFFREIYNSLKHAGNNRKHVVASSDLEITTDLKREAAHMIDAAKEDFRNITISSEVRNKLSQEFFKLLEPIDS
jgi:hypothetical protein